MVREAGFGARQGPELVCGFVGVVALDQAGQVVGDGGGGVEVEVHLLDVEPVPLVQLGDVGDGLPVRVQFSRLFPERARLVPSPSRA